jgi:hypothetical protein
MNAAQALLREVLRAPRAVGALSRDLLLAIEEELEHADTTTAATELAPTAAHLAATTAVPYGEALDALMRAAGYVRADTTPTHIEPIHRTDPAELAAHLAPNAAQLAAASAMSFDEALETLMRMAGFVPASKGPADGGSVTGEQTMRRFGLVRDDVVERRRASLNAEIDAAGKGD